MLKLDITF